MNRIRPPGVFPSADPARGRRPCRGAVPATGGWLASLLARPRLQRVDTQADDVNMHETTPSHLAYRPHRRGKRLEGHTDNEVCLCLWALWTRTEHL